MAARLRPPRTGVRSARAEVHRTPTSTGRPTASPLRPCGGSPPTPNWTGSCRRSAPPVRRFTVPAAGQPDPHDVRSARAEVHRSLTSGRRSAPCPLRPCGGSPLGVVTLPHDAGSAPPVRRFTVGIVLHLDRGHVRSARAEVHRSRPWAAPRRRCPLRPCGGSPWRERWPDTARLSAPPVRRFTALRLTRTANLDVRSARAEVHRRSSPCPRARWASAPPVRRFTGFSAPGDAVDPVRSARAEVHRRPVRRSTTGRRPLRPCGGSPRVPPSISMVRVSAPPVRRFTVDEGRRTGGT